MISVFNTPFEVSLRVLLALSADGKPLTTDMIAAMDFISVYGKNFGIAEANLHGDNSYKYGEFSNRRVMVKKALKSLVIDGMVDVYQKDGGFHFAINDAGEAFRSSLTSEYADEYAQAAKKAVAYIDGKSEREIITEINRQSTTTLRLGGYDG
ncbi:hypothetical protein B1778_01165 [Dehalococcoides mccartyi]|uniref:ABC-three component system middle component 2 n=1 Tax=Dehalococcoides mccartyi TaxID=61435 RepID=UPI00098F7B92|nr:ABC-three component system middle component 2 [Dehalococcoides mccartyi]AQU05377.1 hypothetical protein B1777_01310 [Dehalococcoides mccartyi]AQU06830.1 hypothetical protein B1778_01165 [Dehalococcoides mccartyi]